MISAKNFDADTKKVEHWLRGYKKSWTCDIYIYASYKNYTNNYFFAWVTCAKRGAKLSQNVSLATFLFGAFLQLLDWQGWYIADILHCPRLLGFFNNKVV